MAETRPAPTPFERLIRIADRLRELPAGTAAADAAIHRALDLPGEPRAYTSDEAALRTLLPDGFEAYISTGIGGAVYGVVTRAGDRNYPHHGQWGATPVLAMCGALMRAYAARAKSSKSYGVSSNHARTRPHLRPPIAIDLSRSGGGSVARPMGLGVAVRPATEWRQAMRIRRVTCPLLSQ